MVKINFNKIVPCNFTKQTVVKVVNFISQKEKKVKGEIEINIVDNRLIKKINREFRGIDKITDVLSFAWQEDQVIKTDFLGQIYISYPKIKIQAKENKITINEEFIRMLAHGILHLVGYDHQTKAEADKMFRLQAQVIKKIC